MLNLFSQTPPTYHQKGQYFERRGERATHRIAAAVARKSWKWTLLNLAWTAGPVTFIAMQGGYFIGFGDQAPLQNFIYFAGYTVIAGVLAVSASLAHDAFYRPKVEKEQKHLLETIDRLFKTMLACRNHILTALEPGERQIMAAYYLLQSAGATPSTVGTAVMDLTGRPELAESARRVDVFAEQGMTARIHDEWLAIQPLLHETRDALHAVAPHAYRLLEQRLSGRPPLVREGLARGEGFIARTLDAAQSNDAERMTIQDALDIYTLAFELINGRKIAVLNVRFKGDGAFEEAQIELDEARRDYRQAMRARNSSLRLLVERLYQDTSLEIIIDTTNVDKRLVDAMMQGFRTLQPALRRTYRTDYERLLRLNREAVIRRQKLLKSMAHYIQVWRRDGSKLGLQMQSRDLKQAGFYIEESDIHLEDKEKIRLAHKIDAILTRLNVTGSALAVRDAAAEIASRLDRWIDIGGQEEQIAIESSHAANFGSLTDDLTAPTKAGWAGLVIDALHENRRRASHRIARHLVTIYRVNLTDEMISWFVERFGSDRDFLLSLQAESEESDPLSTAPPPVIDLPAWAVLAG